MEYCLGCCYILSKVKDQDNSFISISTGCGIPLQHFVVILSIFGTMKFFHTIFGCLFIDGN